MITGTFDDRQIWTLALFLKHTDKLLPAAQQMWLRVRNWPATCVNQTASVRTRDYSAAPRAVQHIVR